MQMRLEFRKNIGRRVMLAKYMVILCMATDNDEINLIVHIYIYIYLQCIANNGYKQIR